jgi:hypothetical protein
MIKQLIIVPAAFLQLIAVVIQIVRDYLDSAGIQFGHIPSAIVLHTLLVYQWAVPDFFLIFLLFSHIFKISLIFYLPPVGALCPEKEKTGLDRGVFFGSLFGLEQLFIFN